MTRCGGASKGERMIVRDSTLRLAAMLLLLLAAAPAGAQPSATLASRGEAILTGDCAMCHGIGGTTGGPAYMAPSFFEIAKRRDVDALRESLRKGTLSGHPAMPRTSLSPNDVEAILTYLEAIGAR